MYWFAESEQERERERSCLQQEYLSLIVLQYSDDWCKEADSWKQSSELWQLCGSSPAESLVSVWALALLHLLCYTPHCSRRNWWQTACSKVCQHTFSRNRTMLSFIPPRPQNAVSYLSGWHPYSNLLVGHQRAWDTDELCLSGSASQRLIPHGWWILECESLRTCVCDTNLHLSFCERLRGWRLFDKWPSAFSVTSLLQTLLQVSIAAICCCMQCPWHSSCSRSSTAVVTPGLRLRRGPEVRLIAA